MMRGVFEELNVRGFVHQSTSPELGEVLARGPVTMYIGFDPSARSLHAGSLIPLTMMAHFRRYGHRVIALIGGATGMIGDPSGKSNERALLDVGAVEAHGAAFRQQMERIFAQDEGPPVTFVNNIDWCGPLRLLDFLRDTGKHFSVNQMIQRDSVRTRFEEREAGISYTEFSYMLLQAYDFLELKRRHGCTLQCGASDQWGNIVSGVDLIRRVTGETAYGLTAPLLTNSEGKKYGKTEKGAVFLDPELTSPYAFYQFWFNTADADVVRFLRLFTFLSQEELGALEAKVGSGERAAQKVLAREITRRVHGEAETEKAIRASEALFGGDVRGLPVSLLEQVFAEVPSLSVERSRFEGEGASLLSLLVEVGACPSKSDARRQLGQGGIAVNGVALRAEGSSAEPRLGADALMEGRLLVLRRGKRNHYVVRAT
jgi:tyrosyl-tRNA synthetase